MGVKLLRLALKPFDGRVERPGPAPRAEAALPISNQRSEKVAAKVQRDLECGIVGKFSEFVVLVHVPVVLVHANSETTNRATIRPRPNATAHHRARLDTMLRKSISVGGPPGRPSGAVV